MTLKTNVKSSQNLMLGGGGGGGGIQNEACLGAR